MNHLELIVYISTAALLSCAILFHRRNFAAFLLVAVFWTAGYLVFDRLSQFLTCDETYIFWDVIRLDKIDFLQWSMGVFRTTDIIIGTGITLLRAITHPALDTCIMSAKLLHAIVGIAIIAIMTLVLSRAFAPKSSRPTFQVVIALLVCFLPINLLALKVLNYDLYSMLFGALAVVLLGIGIEKHRAAWYLWSVAAAFAAAQEKLIASPILWTCIVGYAFFFASRKRVETAAAFVPRFFTGCGISLGLALSMNALSYAILWLNRSGNLPKKLLEPGIFFSSFTSGIWILLRGIGGDVLVSRALGYSQAHPVAWLLVLLLLLVAAVLVGSVALFPMIRKRDTRQDAFRERIRDVVPLITQSLLLMVVAGGTIAAYTVNARIAPFVPIQPGAYHPASSFNGTILHFGAMTMPGHYLYSIAWAYANFTLTLPTALTLVCLLCLVIDARAIARGTRTVRIPLFFEIVLFVCLLMPLLYGIAQTPVLPRYFNLFIFLVAVISSLRLSYRVILFRPALVSCTLMVLFLLLVIEAMPFRPLFGSFRPWSINYPREYSTKPVSSYVKPSWEGWGEEMMLAGKWIERQDKDSGVAGRPITIRMFYYGEWLGNTRNVLTRSLVLDTSSLSYTANDYYVINRAGLHMNCGAYPDDASPVHTISFRGFDQAWVYRGDQLARAGFNFPLCAAGGSTLH